MIFTQSAFFCGLLKNSGFVSGYRFSDTGNSSQSDARAGFVSGYRFSDTTNSSQSDTPLGARYSWLLPLHTFPIPFKLLVSTSFDRLSNMQS